MLERWIRGPIGLDSEKLVTRADCRTVLVVIPTMTAGTRLRDLVSLVQGDHRIQTLYTVPDSYQSLHGTAEFAAAGGGLVIPWQQAVNHGFDLVLGASPTGLDQVRGRILVIPHGAGNLMSLKYSRDAGPGGRPHIGLARETLTRRGKLLPSALGLTHDDDLAALRGSCPEALPVAVVAGDICYDRMVASASFRDDYRRALGVADHERLVVVSSTWSTESVFGRHPGLCRRLLTEAAGTPYRIALILHPNVWAVHGRGQVTAWLADCINDGLRVIPPEEGWRATAVASDHVLGDYGSTTQYAAAIGKPVTLAAYPDRAIRTGSIADRVAKAAPRLDLARPLLPQLRHAEPDGRIAELLTSRPGQTAAILRRTMYGLLEMAEPEGKARLHAVPPPEPVTL
ncbi:hypothetical protein [Amycolatopsis sp.]|jgi:hypothetical protein|uniref:hypothetical protein n=1 Tax=Amycolatopsis sp. TaxID=37632 RepID=UPI002DF8648E|nr:hypothetical protein [Amycolatopsis sp.]